MRTVQDCLAQLMEDGILDEVLGRIMSGKEAEVFAAVHRGEPVAVKIFKPRHQRNFKNNAQYLEGRVQVRDTRTQRAMSKGTRFGRQQSESNWKDMEHDALHLAFNAGVRVPRPIFMYEEALLMQLVVDHEGMPAPRMSDLQFTREQATEMHADLFEQVRRLLSCHRIHGDLSAFNVLVATEGPTIIDLPQVVDAAANPQAEQFLVRDWKNIVDHLGRFAPALNAFAYAGKSLYRHYKNGTLDRASATELTENYHPHRKRTERVPPPGNAPRQALPDGRVEFVPGGGGGRQNRFSRQRQWERAPQPERGNPVPGNRHGGHGATHAPPARQPQGAPQGQQPRPPPGAQAQGQGAGNTPGPGQGGAPRRRRRGRRGRGGGGGPGGPGGGGPGGGGGGPQA